MGEISREIGRRIRNFRKSRRMTLEELSALVCKNKSTLSKYETGEIVLDIETIYEIADLAYHVMVLMVEMGISVEDIHKELASRHVIDHKVKQEKMT